MCHRRRKHLGTAEDDCEVKVGPIICTGCSGKTGEYETILKEKNKRKMHLQNCAIGDVNCIILNNVIMRVQRFKVPCPENVMFVRWESYANVLHSSALGISTTSL